MPRDKFRRFRPGVRAFDLTIQSVIIISLVAMTAGTVQSLPRGVLIFCHVLLVLCLLFFVLEYALRIYLAENRWGYIFSFWGIVDFLSIIPSIFLPGSDGLALRAARLIRLVRILKLYRTSHALHRLNWAFRAVRQELLAMLLIALLVFFVAAAGIYEFEHEAQPEVFSSIPAAMWWAVATLTTVGYGDAYPITVAGKIFTGIILVLGLGLVAVPTGLLAAALQRSGEEYEREVR
ncbi:ion transporter [Parvularcula sp. LCG005]|uniref:ion transporter n=1 Tax=Parvularcula sp. LCG005 TaxID=3078805 RepID=UPI0029439D20|nr:ion transporter [Parvularcula sp. LCG005]WOI52635.1 ion transporter [Parvularcula sp. LCG005]